MKMETRKLYLADQPLVVEHELKLGLSGFSLNSYNTLQNSRASLMRLGFWAVGDGGASTQDLSPFSLQKVVSDGLSCLGCRRGPMKWGVLADALSACAEGGQGFVSPLGSG